jgi:5-deoxy-glucuronate isomerase
MNKAKRVPMRLLLKLSPEGGHQRVFKPGEHGIRWLGLEILRLEAGDSWQGDMGGEEAVLVILSGRCTISIRGEETVRWEGLGARRDIFSGPATAVYAPRQSKLEVTAESRLELAMAKAPCETDLPPTLITPGDVQEVSSGVANWRRDVRLIIPPGSSISRRLIVGETLNPPGNWSGIPPHKHDEINDVENRLEEFYLFKTRPSDGYAVQLVYRDGQGQGDIVGNDDLMVFLSSYHPTVASPGTTVCYLWALSGDSRAYDLTIDPRFSWISHAEAVFKEMQRQ